MDECGSGKAGVMWDADLSTKAAFPRLACECAATGGLRRATRSVGKLPGLDAAGRVLGEWMDCYFSPRLGLITLICHYLNARTNGRAHMQW